ncbi:MAG: hypothetical protein COA92_06705 [Sulfurovum sp.]|nr:MAG: hypothetical protein COA92_06705 [Sulfurovum sp.]
MEDKVCEKNNFDQCSYVADYHYQKKEYVKAFKYAEIGCKKSQAKGCDVLGDIYENGFGVKKNESEGLRLHKKSCSLGNGEAGCYGLGVTYSLKGFNAKKNNVKAFRYHAKAHKFYKRGCDKGNDAESCGALADNYKFGLGVKKNGGLSVYYYRKAIKLFDEECKNNNFRACNKIGSMYRDGKGVTKNYRKAAEYYHVGCDKGDVASCFGLGVTYNIALIMRQPIDSFTEDKAMAKKYFLKACDNNIVAGCEQFSELNKGY